MIRELKQKGWTLSAIAREIGFDRKKYGDIRNVRRRLNQKNEQQEEVLDPYKPYLIERMKEGTTNCSVLMDEL